MSLLGSQAHGVRSLIRTLKSHMVLGTVLAKKFGNSNVRSVLQFKCLVRVRLLITYRNVRLGS